MGDDSSYGDEIEERIENLIGKRFIPDGSTKSKIIYDINMDRTPKNTTKYYEKQSYSNFCKNLNHLTKKKSILIQPF